jgi:hypothetical protein
MQDVAVEHCSTLWLEGGGEIRLPATGAAEGKTDSSQSPSPKDGVARKRVLVVDDNEDSAPPRS